MDGTSREMARIRGVSTTDRMPLTQKVAAVLDRDPAEVARLRQTLVTRRDAASATLAFELAGRLQQEAEALDWITAEQKVTSPARPDCDIHGWADGTLVRFEFRAGRLAGWTQRRCGEPSARPHLAGTPPEWRDFAQRNAILAARLST
jgi:excinuclease ABC subunit C